MSVQREHRELAAAAGEPAGGLGPNLFQALLPAAGRRILLLTLQNSGNGKDFKGFRYTSQLFWPFPRAADFLHGLQRICHHAPKAITVRRIFEEI